MASLWLPAPTRGPPPAAAGPGSRRHQQRQQQLQQPPPSSRAVTATGGGAGAGAAGSSSSSPPPERPAAPTYEERCDAAASFSRLAPEQRALRKGSLFVPRSVRDFDDGGAFPEIHVAQYPRNMGNPHLARRRGAAAAGAGAGGANGGGGGAGALTVAGSASAIGSKSGQVLNVTIDADGEVSYDAVVTGGTNADRKVYTRHSDLKGSDPTEDDIALPTAEEERRAAERTAAALGSLIEAKVAMDKPTGSAMIQAATSKGREERTQFVRYTPREDAPGYNPSAKQRVIQMVPAQVDPMQPPKHKHKKAPRGPAEDPVPVLHAPPEKLTKEERDKWNVPACISNWKNTRGYTIPLDKRLAADGRGLRDEQTVNPNFATLSESLYVAERQAREEVRMRAQVQKRLAEAERDRREAELRELANRARMERSGGPPPAAAPAAAPPVGLAAAPSPAAAGVPRDAHEGRDRGIEGRDRVTDDRGPRPDVVPDEPAPRPTPDSEDAVAAQQRDLLRRERRREREKELRLERLKSSDPAGGGGARAAAEDEELAAKRRRLESERDVSEKIALGTLTGTGAGTGGGDADSRLYNQSAGMDSGFGRDDEYDTYSEPMFNRRGVGGSSIYRPTRGEAAMDGDEQYDRLVKGATAKFQVDKGFAGAEGGDTPGGGTAGPRTAPVQFERGDRKD